MPQSAEQALDYHDRERRADDALPHGNVGAEIQRQQEAGDYRAQVADGLFAAGDEVEQELGDDRADNACGQHWKRLHAEDDDGGDSCGQQCDYHVEHDAAAGVLGMDMGCG